MKVIMPMHKGYLGAHFGRAEQFIVYEIENGEVKDKKEISAAYDVRHKHHKQIAAEHTMYNDARFQGADAEHQCNHESESHSAHEGHSGHHGAIAQFMKSNGTDVLITCGIGPCAVNDIESQGIKIISGIAPGRPDEIINDFINNKLKQDLTVKVCRH